MASTAAAEPKPGLLIAANWPSDVGYAWSFMERIWDTLARHHEFTGGTTHLIYPEIRSVPDRIREAPVQVHELDFSDRSPTNRDRMEAFVKAHGIRSVYLTDRAALDPFYAALRRWGVCTIVNNDQTPGDRTTSTLKRTVKTLLHRAGAFSVDLNVAPSQFVMRRFREVYGLTEGRCTLIYNGIEPIDVPASDPDYVHQEFDIPMDALVVVSLSRAARYKGISFIIKCAERVISHRCRDDIYFLHCGDGPDLEAFRAEVSERGLEGRFLLPGARYDYRDILPSCDVAIHASRGEGFSLAVLEMMSAALPLLVPDNSGNREAVEHERSGFYYPEGDLGAACSRLGEILDDPEARRTIGDAARERVLDHFTLERMLRDYRSVVGTVLSGAPSSTSWPNAS